MIEAVTKLGKAIAEEERGIELSQLTLSQVITRNDDLQLDNKVNLYNKKLDNLCAC